MSLQHTLVLCPFPLLKVLPLNPGHKDSWQGPHFRSFPISQRHTSTSTHKHACTQKLCLKAPGAFISKIGAQPDILQPISLNICSETNTRKALGNITLHLFHYAFKTKGNGLPMPLLPIAGARHQEWWRTLGKLLKHSEI